MAVLKPYVDDYYLWDYIPTRIGAIIAVVLFVLATLAVIFRSIKTRTRFSIPFILGGIFQAIGYSARAASEDKTDELLPYIIQSIFILVAPALFAASIYMILGRLMRSVHGERHAIIRPQWLTRAFVTGDVLSFLIQCGGGGMMAISTIDKNLASNIVLAGLVVQILLFGLFALTAIIFHSRMRKWPSGASLDPKSKWEQIMYTLYAMSALILIRSVFRVIEYVMGKTGYPLTHEWTLYVFDAILMFSTMVIFAVWYPGQLTPPVREWERPDTDIVMDGAVSEDDQSRYTISRSRDGLTKPNEP